MVGRSSSGWSPLREGPENPDTSKGTTFTPPSVESDLILPSLSSKRRFIYLVTMVIILSLLVGPNSTTNLIREDGGDESDWVETIQ